MKSIYTFLGKLNATMKMFIAMGLAVLISIPAYKWALDYNADSLERVIVTICAFALNGLLVYKFTQWFNKLADKYGYKKK